MKFALVVLETAQSKRKLAEDHIAHRKQIETWLGEQAQAGVLVGGEAFDTAGMPAVTVRRHTTGVVEVTEGPFCDGPETLGGFVVIEAADRGVAVDIAASWPTPETLEIRPLSPDDRP